MDSFSHSPVLFVENDGRALEFYSYYTGEDKATIVLMIEHGGGIFHSEKVGSALCLVDLGDESVENLRGEVAVSMKFIWDCVEKNVLLDVNEYIMTTPLKPFRKEEDITIIKFVLKHAEYPHMTLDQFYQSLSKAKGVLNRDAYSIKSRAKRIYYQIETYNLSESDERKFKSVIKPVLMYGNYYENDDYVLLNYLKNHISRVHQRELYVELEKRKILQHSAKSLFYRALKLILPNIDLYDVGADFKSSVKRHLSQIYKIQSESSLKDYVMIHYIQANIKYMRNITLYQRMAEKKILNHSAEYMQLRFLYHILPNIDSYNIPTYFKKRFKNVGFDGFSIFYDESLAISHWRKYTSDEDYIIIHYLHERKVEKAGLSIFREMEKEKILNRAASSMHYRLKNWIIPNIDSYDIPHIMKLFFKKKSKQSQSKLKENPTPVSNLNTNIVCPSESEISVHNSDIFAQTSGKGSDSARKPSRNGGVENKKSEQVASSTKVTEAISDVNIAPSLQRKRKKCLPLPDSDTDSEASHHLDTRSNVQPPISATPSKRRSKSNTRRSKSKTRKQSPRSQVCNPNYAGDVFNYFLSQRSLPDDGSAEVNAFFSQNSLISDGSTRKAGPCPVDPPCFLQAVLDRCQVIPDDQNNETDNSFYNIVEALLEEFVEDHKNELTTEKLQELHREQQEGAEELSSSEEEMSKGGISTAKEHFPVEVKMRFMSQAIALLQNIEYNEVFHDCVHDSLFYQKLVFRIYRLNSTVYKHFLEKEVSSIMEKDELNLSDKAFLIKYLSCLEKISPENPLEVFSRCKLR